MPDPVYVTLYTLLVIGITILLQKLFVPQKFQPDEIFTTFSRIMSSNNELYTLSYHLVKELCNRLKISKAAFILIKENIIYDIIPEGFDGGLDFAYEELIPLMGRQEILLVEQIDDQKLKSRLMGLGVALVRLLKVKDEPIGFLILGKKIGNKKYQTKDLQLLSVLTDEIALAIKNSQSFDQIKQFNITLSQGVKKATADLVEANKKLKDLDKVKDDFVSVASHELRTPMTAVRSYAWMALYRPDIPLSDKMKKYLTRVLISTERTINLVNDLLNVSRLESGQLAFRPEAFQVVEEVQDALNDLSVKFNEKKISVSLLPSHVPMIFADKEKVTQVLYNLLGNALKFTPQGGHIEVSFFCDGVMVEVKVKDTGVGISKEDLGRLFQKFGRLDNSYVAAAVSGGTGLGLYISKYLIESMRGKIWAESEGVGYGSTFTFSLPVATQAVLSNASKYVYLPKDQVKVLEPVAV